MRNNSICHIRKQIKFVSVKEVWDVVNFQKYFIENLKRYILLSWYFLLALCLIKYS